MREKRGDIEVKGTYIYISHAEKSLHEYEEIAESIYMASTDIKDILDVFEKADFSEGTITILKNGATIDSKNRETIDLSLSKVAYLVKNYSTELYNDDSEEFNYVVTCLIEWCKNRDAYNEKERTKRELERTLEIEERELKEYKRLKRKYSKTLTK